MKNLLLLLAMLITSSTVFSQLYVKPLNGSTDSYVYVKDQVLFVEDDINLQENNAGDEQASIYLREGSQLIQGSGSTANSGDGYISIYQTIDSTSNYHYNFWHSPVGKPSSGISGNRNAGVSRLYDINDVTDSDAVATTTGSNGNSTTDPITVSTRWIYTRTSSPANEQEGNYIHVAENDNIAAGYGFTMKGVSDGAVSQSQEYDFRGRPNNGTITVPVLSGTQWTLSGNPYPSALDLKEFFWDNDNENGLTGILFWDEPKKNEFTHQYTGKSGGYGVWIPGPDNTVDDPGFYVAPPFKNYSANGGLGGDSGTGNVTDVDRRYSPVGQGFVLRTTNASADNIVLQNDQRIFKKIGEVSEIRIQEDNEGPTERSSFNSDALVVITPQIRINMTFNDEFARQLLLAFHDESTDGYDVGLDAHHPMDSGGAEAYYLIEENEEMGPFVIQTRPYAQNKQIPIGFSLNEQTKISVNTIEILNFNSPAFLWDSLEDTYVRIKESNPLTRTYSFILPAGVHNDRFYIVFRDLANDIEGSKATEIAKASVDFFQNNPYKQMEISNPEGYNIKSAAIYDMTGKLVATKQNVGTASSFNIPTSNIADGVYLIKLTTIDNINIDYKTIIQNK